MFQALMDFYASALFIIIDKLFYWTLITDGAGGKGTWGKLLDTDGDSHIDRNDPNYDSGEVIAAFSSS